ncbi:MAG: hypothetical protein U9N49_08055, partial [Campylobacterota bacterium]|nr:hypothetical protein [Campylobacterota bacterium]
DAYTDHLHFAIYSGTIQSLVSIDIANRLTNFVEPIQSWVEWCSSEINYYNSPWWNLGGIPCP